MTTESERMTALREYDILDTPFEAAFDRITALAADLFNTPIAAVSLIDEDRQWFKSIIGLETRETPREYAFCDRTIRSDDVLVVPDAELDERFRTNPLVLKDPLIRFYAGAPLRLPGGLRLGALCIIDREPRKALTAEEKRRLQALAQIVVSELDLRLAGRRLSLARKQAEAASEAKSEFLANMSHELRTPLTSIIGFAGILGASPHLGVRERRFAERIEGASKNLLAIVNDVLDLARLESGGVSMISETVDPRELATGAIDLVAEQASAKGLAVVLDAAGELPSLQIDGARLRQVLLNLLSNAVKFTETGEVRVTVKVEGEWVVISVKDSGIGIAPDRLDHIFERFVQADPSIAKRFGGTGLGLAISRRLAEQMGGKLEAESVAGQGSTFSIRLPIRP